MRKWLLFSALWLVCLTRIAAQTPTVNWSEPNVASAAQAQGFTFRLYLTPSGSTTANPPVVVASVTCSGSGTAPITATCSAPLPSGMTAALVTGAKTTITSQDTVNGSAESAQSVPFTAGSAVPTGLRIQ